MLLYYTLCNYALHETDHVHVAYVDMNTGQEYPKCKPQVTGITSPTHIDTILVVSDPVEFFTIYTSSSSTNSFSSPEYYSFRLNFFTNLFLCVRYKV